MPPKIEKNPTVKQLVFSLRETARLLCMDIRTLRKLIKTIGLEPLVLMPKGNYFFTHRHIDAINEHFRKLEEKEASYVTIPDCAEIFGISRGKVKQMLKDENVPCIKSKEHFRLIPREWIMRKVYPPTSTSNSEASGESSYT